MFKNLRNEARVFFWLRAGGPILIRGADEPGLDPLLPDMRFVRAWRNGQEAPYIPGSSLKGVLRSRAEQIVRALAPKEMIIQDLFDEQREMEKEMRNRSGREVYYASDPLTQLFGQTYLAGRLSCSDAFPIEGEPVRLNVRTHVAINRITGATQGKALFTPEVVEEGVFGGDVTLTNFALWQLKLVGLLLQDLDEGYVLLGGSTTRGYGRVKVENVRVTVRDYRCAPPGPTIRGYEDDDVADVGECRFDRKEYCWECSARGIEWFGNLKIDIVAELERLLRKQTEARCKREKVSHGG